MIEVNKEYTKMKTLWMQRWVKKFREQNYTPQSLLANNSYTLLLRSDGQVQFPQTTVGAYNAASVVTTGT